MSLLRMVYKPKTPLTNAWYGFIVIEPGMRADCQELLTKPNCPLLSVAVQNRQPAGLCHCEYTCQDLLSTYVCSGPTPVQCHSAFDKLKYNAQRCCAKQAASKLVPLQIHLWRFALGVEFPKLRNLAVQCNAIATRPDFIHSCKVILAAGTSAVL